MSIFDFLIFDVPSEEILSRPIWEKWAELGWGWSFLGYPITDVRVTPAADGRYMHFEGGSIYWTPWTGAHEVHGDIRWKWSELGWEQGFLGYPITDETGTPDGVGRYSYFERGGIYWSPRTGAHEVHGDIHTFWANQGYETGALGYPMSDELTAPNGNRYSVFEDGVVSWDPITGARIAEYVDIPSQSIINVVDQELNNIFDEENIPLSYTGATELTQVHHWYEYEGNSYYRVMELDFDLKYRRKGIDPSLNLDLFLTFDVQGENVVATLIREKHDVDFPRWLNGVTLGIGKIVERIVNGLVEKELGKSIIGQSFQQDFGGLTLLASQLQDDGSLRLFGDTGFF